MRIAAVDIGSNSTRLLIADSNTEGITELQKTSQVTRLAEAVETTGRISGSAVKRLLKVLDDYHEQIQQANCQLQTAVMTSAVRDAKNGPELMQQINLRYSLNARTISGEEEAKLTFEGAVSERTLCKEKPTLVVDIGGGSTELAIGIENEILFQRSLQIGVVRQSERHLTSDPPTQAQLEALKQDVKSSLTEAVPAALRSSVKQCIAVAGTATTAAAIDQQLEPYDSSKVHGYSISREAIQAILTRLVTLPLKQRAKTAGLHPDRAPTVVAGLAILNEVVEHFSLTSIEASEHDLLRGVIKSCLKECC